MMMMMSKDVLVDEMLGDLTDDCIIYILLVMLQSLMSILHICIHRLYTYFLYKFSTSLMCEDRLSGLVGDEGILQTKRALQIDSLTGCIAATFTE